MNFKVITIASFDRQIKRLAKKYPSMADDFARLLDWLAKEPIQGKSLGGNVYKIRLRIASKQTGKSGGARVITCVKVVQETVYLLSIYDKSEQSDISDEKIQELLREIPSEL